MPQYEGLISGTMADGKAEVVIQPESAGVVGAPHLAVCHRPSDSSKITLQAFNKANAGVGDLVLIRSDSMKLLKNALKLLGIPLLGLISAGITTAVLSQSLVLHRTSVFFVFGAGLLAGIIIGAVTYRRTCGREPVITQILRKGAGVSFCELKTDSRNGNGSPGGRCDLCSPS